MRRQENPVFSPIQTVMRSVTRLALAGLFLGGALFRGRTVAIAGLGFEFRVARNGIAVGNRQRDSDSVPAGPDIAIMAVGGVFRPQSPDGSRIVLRHRITLVGTWIEHGPESRYIGVAGSPSLEWWNKSGTTSLYTGSGGGAGLIDSQHVKGAQGQDLTFNWFIRGGLEHITPHGTHLTAGIMYQHMSNGGQTVPNPGIDALGFTLGWARKF